MNKILLAVANTVIRLNQKYDSYPHDKRLLIIVAIAMPFIIMGSAYGTLSNSRWLFWGSIYYIAPILICRIAYVRLILPKIKAAKNSRINICQIDE